MTTDKRYDNMFTWIQRCALLGPKTVECLRKLGLDSPDGKDYIHADEALDTLMKNFREGKTPCRWFEITEACLGTTRFLTLHKTDEHGKTLHKTVCLFNSPSPKDVITHMADGEGWKDHDSYTEELKELYAASHDPFRARLTESDKELLADLTDKETARKCATFGDAYETMERHGWTIRIEDDNKAEIPLREIHNHSEKVLHVVVARHRRYISAFEVQPDRTGERTLRSMLEAIRYDYRKKETDGNGDGEKHI